MAAQPITSAHKRPHRFLSIDTGALLLAASLACHWQALSTTALALGLFGAGTLAFGGYQAMRLNVSRTEAVRVAADSAADVSLSRRHPS